MINFREPQYQCYMDVSCSSTPPVIISLFPLQGEMGWMKIIRGVDAFGIEQLCDWAVPKLEPTLHGPYTGSAQWPAALQVKYAHHLNHLVAI